MRKHHLPAPRPKQGRRSDFPRLLGGNLCLDFVNTIEERRGRHPQDFLPSAEALVHWSGHVSILQPAQAARLIRKAARSPKAATGYWKQAVALREAVYGIFVAIARNARFGEKDLGILKQRYLEGVKAADLSATAHGYHWQWNAPNQALDTIGWRVAQAAVELLSSEELRRVKECPNCGWLFVDVSKNHSRRWCSMEGCGSRVKARRQYALKHRR